MKTATIFYNVSKRWGLLMMKAIGTLVAVLLSLAMLTAAAALLLSAWQWLVSLAAL